MFQATRNKLAAAVVALCASPSDVSGATPLSNAPGRAQGSAAAKGAEHPKEIGSVPNGGAPERHLSGARLPSRPKGGGEDISDPNVIISVPVGEDADVPRHHKALPPRYVTQEESPENQRVCLEQRVQHAFVRISFSDAARLSLGSGALIEDAPSRTWFEERKFLRPSEALIISAGHVVKGKEDLGEGQVTVSVLNNGERTWEFRPIRVIASVHKSSTGPDYGTDVALLAVPDPDGQLRRQALSLSSGKVLAPGMSLVGAFAPGGDAMITGYFKVVDVDPFKEEGVSDLCATLTPLPGFEHLKPGASGGGLVDVSTGRLVG
jgi:hypothetical protein